jgi:hypothetical protein
LDDVRDHLYKAYQKADGKQALAINKLLEDNNLLNLAVFYKQVTMSDILDAKFKDPDLIQLLKATGNSRLIAHSYGKNGEDTFWSDGWNGNNCEGLNVLGTELMRIRRDLNNQRVSLRNAPLNSFSSKFQNQAYIDY